ncbi:metallophosphoesterase [Paenibacillus sanfengchensis]|uniref:metallophosphoesterase n=1 Tax=Paenibacillus sanfengchensis TaxID=3119819 RepID=UPI002FE18542
MKYFITDLHGEYKGLDLLLKHAEIDFATDQLVIGGDMINRGKESGRVIKKLKDLVDEYPKNVFALIGNHEEMMRNYYRNGETLWLSHGGKDTIRDLEKTFPNQAKRKEYNPKQTCGAWSFARRADLF